MQVLDIILAMVKATTDDKVFNFVVSFETCVSLWTWCKAVALYKKWSFPLRISSVNVTKSVGNYKVSIKKYRIWSNTKRIYVENIFFDLNLDLCNSRKHLVVVFSYNLQFFFTLGCISIKLYANNRSVWEAGTFTGLLLRASGWVNVNQKTHESGRSV